MTRADFLAKSFAEAFQFEPTPCQDAFFKQAAEFLSSDDGDIFVVNGYAGTGKTSAVAAVINALREMRIKTVLMAPTGRAAKVLSRFSGKQAQTIHKVIYRQKSVGAGGVATFSLNRNEFKNTLFVVDEASLIGIDAQGGNSLFGSGNLLEDLVTFLRAGTDCRLIMLGDSAQLPPVGMDESPALDHSYMEGFGGVRFCTLSTVVRQAEKSGILRNATALRCNLGAGRLKLFLRDFPDIERVSGENLIDAITSAYDKYGEDETIVLCRSNKRAIRYNLGIRATVQYKEERLLRGDALMIVKNCYQFLPEESPMGYIANGDVARLVRISGYEERYGLHFATATLAFPDYDDLEVKAKVCLDTLESESASLTPEQQNALYEGVDADYSHISARKKRYEAVREDPFYNALQLKYAQAVTCHKAQGGQWDCVFIDCPFWGQELSEDDLKWMYTALTRAVKKVYLVDFPDSCFE
ncbi:MAG: AAA family ATPase [Bacteroidales bacterium]|nr:AAA family ATPase [Candidatus Cryptobacteroides aphodequi]